MLGKRTARTLDNDIMVTDRRGFLRRAGITGALVAAVAGGAELTGLGTAFAATKHGNKAHSHGGSNAGCCVTCTYTPGKCNGGNPCKGGYCCFHCVCNSPTCCNPYYQCISGHCSTFTEC